MKKPLIFAGLAALLVAVIAAGPPFRSVTVDDEGTLLGDSTNIFTANSNLLNQAVGAASAANVVGNEEGFATNLTLVGNTTNLSAVASRAAVFDEDQRLNSSAVTTTELGHLSGVTGGLQTNIQARLAQTNGTAYNMTVDGITNILNRFWFQGDSLTVQTNSSTGAGLAWPDILLDDSSWAHNNTNHNFSIPGQRASSMDNLYASTFGSTAGSLTVSSNRDIAIVLGGHNDINQSATSTNALESLWGKLKADGFFVVAFTITGQTNTWNSTQLNLWTNDNAWIRSVSSQYDALVDADAYITNYSTQTIDGTHYTPATAAGIANLVKGEITPALSGRWAEFPSRYRGGTIYGETNMHDLFVNGELMAGVGISGLQTPQARYSFMAPEAETNTIPFRVSTGVSGMSATNIYGGIEIGVQDGGAFYNASGDWVGMYWYALGNNNVDLRFGRQWSSDASPQWLATIKPNSGNVGIGLTNPATKLHVDGVVTADSFSGSISGDDIDSGTLADARLSSTVANLDQAETITGDWVNTANPWADNEVSDTLTIGASSTVADGAIPAGITRDTEWDTAAKINAATTDEDFLVDSDIGSTAQAWDTHLDELASQVTVSRFEAGDSTYTVHDLGTISGAVTLPWSTNSYEAVLDGDTTITWSGSAPGSGEGATRVLWATMDGVGGHTVTNGTESVDVRDGAGEVTRIGFSTKDAGSTVIAESNYAPSASGAPTDAQYWVGAADAGLSAEIVVNDSAGLRAALSDETGTGAAVFAGGAIGAATATTPTAGDDDTSVATTAFVQDSRHLALAVADLADDATPSVLTAEETTNKLISNYKTSGADHVFTMPAAHVGGNVTFVIGDEFQVDIEPNASDLFYLNGTAMAADEHIQNTADTLGDTIVGFVANINGTLRWMFRSSDANWVEATP